VRLTGPLAYPAAQSRGAAFKRTPTQRSADPGPALVSVSCPVGPKLTFGAALLLGTLLLGG
jgi:hypothetical protein